MDPSRAVAPDLGFSGCVLVHCTLPWAAVCIRRLRTMTPLYWHSLPVGPLWLLILGTDVEVGLRNWCGDTFYQHMFSYHHRAV